VLAGTKRDEGPAELVSGTGQATIVLDSGLPVVASHQEASSVLDALLAKLKAEAVAFQSDVLRGPRCRMAVCLDGEGNSLLLHQLNAS